MNVYNKNNTPRNFLSILLPDIMICQIFPKQCIITIDQAYTNFLTIFKSGMLSIT